MRRAATALALMLAGCERQPEAARSPALAAGNALERAAVAAGVVADPASIDPVGAYASDTDRVCVIHADGEVRGKYRIGVAVDYGEGQGCVARGTASGTSRLDVRLADDCRFEATLDDRRIAFPATLPAACDRRLCSGRATLTAVIGERLSGSATEAQAMRAADGEQLCGS